jgi:phospholipase C
VSATIDVIRSSPDYQDNTLILLTWDEGGGFFDHVAPPASLPPEVDADDLGNPVPYGTRVPFLAIGPFAKAGTVSHKPMEHSSIVKFLEWNFLTEVGQLKARDTAVNNIGSLLDPTKTGIQVPEEK